MSQELSIQEAGKSRNFSGVGAIETETPEGDSVFWVPESERELESEYVFSNGTYRPRKYGFSDIDVDVFEAFTDLDGNDGEIKIDDYELPHIDFDDWDIHIDELGNPEIDIDIHIYTPDAPGVDVPDVTIDIPFGDVDIDLGDVDITIKNPDSLNFDYDIDLGEWSIDTIAEIIIDDATYPPGKVKIKGDGEKAMVTLPDGTVYVIDLFGATEPVIICDIVSFNFDTNTNEWVVKAEKECTVDGIVYHPGDEIRRWKTDELTDLRVKETLKIPDDFPDFPDVFDPEKPIDIYPDTDSDMPGIGISGEDMDGLPVDVKIDPSSFDFEQYDLPDEIRIMHVPNKTSYKDGEEIDLDGLVVQAYRGDEVWEDKEGKYWQGYIPAHELIAGQAHKNSRKGASVGSTVNIKSENYERVFYDDELKRYAFPIGTINLTVKPLSSDTLALPVTLVTSDNKKYTIIVLTARRAMSTELSVKYSASYSGTFKYKVEEKELEKKYSFSGERVVEHRGLYNSYNVGDRNAYDPVHHQMHLSYDFPRDSMLPGFARMGIEEIKGSYSWGIDFDGHGSYHILMFPNAQTNIGQSSVKARLLTTDYDFLADIVDVLDPVLLSFYGGEGIASGTTVSWQRPKDGKMLYAPLNVFVED